LYYLLLVPNASASVAQFKQTVSAHFTENRAIPV